MASTLRYTHSTGVTHDREACLACLRQGPRLEQVEVIDQVVLDPGDAA